MNVTWSIGWPTGEEKGSFLTLDLGGTNLRVCWITLSGRREEITLLQEQYKLPDDVKTSVALPARSVTLSELQRTKRQFVAVNKKAITLGTTEKGALDWSEGSIARKFAAYIEENIRP